MYWYVLLALEEADRALCLFQYVLDSSAMLWEPCLMPGCEFGQVYQGSSPEVYGFERSRNDLAFQTYIPTFRAVILVYMSAMGGCVSSNAEQEGNPDLQRRAAVTGWSDRKGIPENATRVEYTDYEQLKVGVTS